MPSASSLEHASRAATQLEVARHAAGFDQNNLDHAARQGFNNGAFEDSEEDISAIVEEFLPGAEARRGPAGSAFKALTDSDAGGSSYRAHH